MDVFSIYLLSVLVALVYAIFKEKSNLKYLYAGIALVFILLKYGSPVYSDRLLILLTILILSFVIYGAVKKGLSMLGRAAIISAASFVALLPLAYVLMGPMASLFPILNIIPVGLGIAWFVTKDDSKEEELSPFLLLIPFALTQLIFVLVGFG
ncbi:MAG: hypothetical protein ACI857_002549 [Arenicella sp.]|jgi:hypothetical protein